MVARNRSQRAVDKAIRDAEHKVRNELVRLIASGEEKKLERIYARMAGSIRRQLRAVGFTEGEVADIIREEFQSTFEARYQQIVSAVHKGARAGIGGDKRAFDTTYGEQADTSRIPRFASTEQARAVAARRINATLYRDKLTLSARLHGNDRKVIEGMRQQINGSLRANEGIRRVAERVLDLDRNAVVNIPEYVEEMSEAARVAKRSAKGVRMSRGESMEDIAKRWRRSVRKLGQGPNKQAGAYTMRSASRHALKKLEKATPAQVDKIVDRWALDKAQYQAKLIARNETVEAYRSAYKKSTQDKPYIVGYRWSLSGSHPKLDECFPAGTLVETASGARPIEDICVGEMVLTHSGRLRRVVRLHRTTPTEGLLRLRFQEGTSRVREVVATPNHPFATDRGWVEAGDLQIGDRGRALVGACGTPGHLRGDDMARTCRGDSRQSSPSGYPQTSAEARRAGPLSLAHRMDTSAWLAGSTPTRTSGSGRRRFLESLRTIAGYLVPSALWRTALESLRASSTCFRGASRSWGSPLLCWTAPCTEPSSTFWRTQDGQRGHRTRGTEAHGRSESSRSGSASSAESPSRIHGKAEGAGAVSPASTFALPAPRTSWCRSVVSRGETLDLRAAPHRSPGSDSGTARKALADARFLGACETSTTVDTVFNLEVEEDHTYFANGILVHNCDALAAQDLHGLGPGGYPADALPQSPHPADLCVQTGITDPHFFDREASREFGDPEPPKPWESGVRDDPAEWYKRNPEKRREILGPTRERIFAQDPSRVIDSQGKPVPVHVAEGRPPRQRQLGREVRVRPLVRADRASMVEPLPEAPARVP